MNKKLTLLLDEEMIQRAKVYAERRNETLSGLVEGYFRYLTAKGPGKKRVNVSRDIEALTGIIRVPENLDVKRDYRRHRVK